MIVAERERLEKEEQQKSIIQEKAKVYIEQIIKIEEARKAREIE